MVPFNIISCFMKWPLSSNHYGGDEKCPLDKTGQLHIWTHNGCDITHKIWIFQFQHGEGSWVWNPTTQWGVVGNCQLLGDKGSAFYKNIGSCKLTILQWKVLHLWILGQQKLARMAIKRHKIGCAGKERWIWEELWGRVNMFKTCCTKFSKK